MIGGAALVLAVAAVVAAPVPPPRPSADPAIAAPAVPEPPERPEALAAVPAPVAAPPAAAALSPLPPAAGQMACRDPRLTGAPVPDIVGGLVGCGVFRPVRITEIAGIQLSDPAVLDCPTARTFANWLTGIADPAARATFGRRITGVWVMGSYTCRTRNGEPGARVSEHGAGRAIDVGGVTLAGGRRVTVEHGWRDAEAGTFLRHLWAKACGPFTTVLGPEADRHHHDHLHLDTAYREESYCR